jgi:O-antigen/teichoic acid export membrane protein
MGVSAMFVLGLPIGLLGSIVLARALGPEAFGQYSFAIAVLAVLAMPACAGVPQLLTREVASYTHEGAWPFYRGIVRSAHEWVIVVSVLVWTVYVAVGPLAGLLPDRGKWALMGIVILLVPIHGFNAVRNGTIKGLGYPAIAELPTQLVQSILLLVLFASASALGLLTARSAVWLQVVAGVFTFAVATAIFVRIRPAAARQSRSEFDRKSWFVALVPFTLISVMVTLSAQVGILLVGLFGRAEAVAALRVAERCSQFVVLSLSLGNMVLSPHVVRIWRQGDRRHLQKLSRQAARATFLLAFPIALTLLVFGKTIIRVTFGDEYVDLSYWPMVILVVAQLFNVGLGSVGMLLTMSGNERAALGGYAAALVATVVSAYLLIPHLEQVGAAIAVAMGIVVMNCVSAHAVLRRLKIRPGIF